MLREEYDSLSPALKHLIQIYTSQIKKCKWTLQMTAGAAGAGDICGGCRGECCNGGKNHVTVVELLVYFSDGMDLFDPRFERDICPYLADNGCLMAPEYRPYNCITFVCERIDGRLSLVQKERLFAAERELRSLYDGIERLFDNCFRYGLFSCCERSLSEKPAPILRGAALGDAKDQQGKHSDAMLQ